MCLVELDAEGLSLSIWVNKRDGYEVLLHVNASEIAKSEWPIERSVGDGTPQIDDLKTPFEQRGRIGGRKVAMNTLDGGSCRLVYVHLRDGLTPLGIVIGLARSTAADG